MGEVLTSGIVLFRPITPGKLNKAQLKYCLNPGLKLYVDHVYV